jgi:DNA-directed RNA polymerase subunit RPC12/RpoP
MNIAESARHHYNCPKCGKKVYAVKGLYEGDCVTCLSSQNLVEQGFNGLKGVGNGIGKAFGFW